MHDATYDQMILIANLYYNEGLDQPLIARKLKISQAHVSRLLHEGRKRGVIQISVANFEARIKEMEVSIKSKLGIKSVYVFKVMSSYLSKKKEAEVHEELRHSLAYFAKVLAPEIIKDGQLTALGAGRMLYEFVDQMAPLDIVRPITALQAVGNVSATVAEYDSSEITRLFGKKFKGRSFTLNSPAIVADRKLRDALLKIEQIHFIKEKLGKVDSLLMGIGTKDVTVFKSGGLTPTDWREVHEAGAVAEVCGRFLDKDGHECKTSLQHRTISIEVSDLKKIPNVVCIIEGANRMDAVLAATRGGIIKTLIIDEIGAGTLLSKLA